MPPKGVKVVASNRKARHDYSILETVEAGISLAGSEVKSLREGKVQLADAYARVDGHEMWLYAMHVPPYSMAAGFGTHEPDRRRKLLLHRRQIDELGGRVAREHLALVPLALYFTDGRAKVELALARGRRKGDRRQAIAERDAELEARRAMARGRRSDH